MTTVMHDHGKTKTMAGGDSFQVTRVPFSCPVCGRYLVAESSSSGREVNCPGCGSLIMTPAAGIGPGTRLDDFVLKRRLGRGAMAEVYLAEQRSLGRTVAVKILSPAWSSNNEMANRFQHEVRTLARLGHPHIVAAFYAGRVRGVDYLAMQYVEGCSLFEHVQQHGPMTEPEALSVVYKVADALRYAWKEHGLIHRDIKPANIMLQADGEVMLTDLGISKCIYEDESVTHGHRIFGTPHYMSPEQARGRLDLDFRTDQYSLGATLYHMLAGGPPFDTREVGKIIELQCHADPPPLRERRPDVSRGCIALMERMMAKDPAGRFRSWDEIITAAGEILDRTPTREFIVHDPQPEDRPQATTGRRKGHMPFVLAAVLAMAAVTGWWVLSRSRDSGREALIAIPGEVREAGDAVRAQIDRMQEAVETYRDEMEEEKRREALASDILASLDKEAARLVVLGRVEEAIAVYRDYGGPMADILKPQRRERIADLSLPAD